MYDNEAKMNVGGALRGRTLQGPGLESAQDIEAVAALKLAQAQRQPEIPLAMERLAQSQDRLSQRVFELKARLVPVLKPEMPEEDANLKPEHSPQTSLGAALFERISQADYIDQILIQILRHLEF
jgi:nicotinamidase-related amidase